MERKIQSVIRLDKIILLLEEGMEVLGKICKTLNCTLDDAMEFGEDGE